MPDANALGAILGSAFAAAAPWRLEPVPVVTEHGAWTLYRTPEGGWVSFRHGLPHRFLPHQIPYRAQAAALASVGVKALLVTSSAGVLDPTLPLHTPLPVGDLYAPEQRLGDGSPCTMWPAPSPHQGHLVWQEGPLSRGLLVQLEAAIGPLPAPVCFAGQLGPRTKTAAESEALRRLGCQVNSMTLAPEVVLAAELGLATLPVVVGHKRSGASAARLAADEVAGSLEAGKAALVALVVAFFTSVLPVPSGNLVYRFHG